MARSPKKTEKSEATELPYKKGDVLMNGGKLYQVFKIQKKKTGEVLQKVMFYKRLYAPNKGGEIICSVPIANISKTRIRNPHSKKQLEKLFSILKKKTEGTQKVDINNSSDIIFSEKIVDKAHLLKDLWLEKNQPDVTFSHTKKKVFTQILRVLREEIAYAFNIPVNDAEKKILSALKTQG